jgi:hypothetical protein
MAENKNGFVLYKDLISVVRKLVLKDRENKTNYGGELFLLVLEYVNDESPIAIDFILEMTFEPIKQQLKRDLKKYETTITKKSESGRIGNLKKWHLDIYKDYESGIISLEVAEKIANDRKVSQCDKSIANIADIDSVIDTVSDTDTVTDILLEKETKEENISKEKPEELFQYEQPTQELVEEAKEFIRLQHEEERKKVPQKKERTEPPDIDTFMTCAREIYQNELNIDFSPFIFAVTAKYNSWIDAGWKDGHKKPIHGWKNKLRNTIPHLKPVYGKSNYNSGGSRSNIPSKQATFNIEAAIQRTAEDFTKGNIPGVYR